MSSTLTQSAPKKKKCKENDGPSLMVTKTFENLEVYNEDDDLGNRGLQTEQVGVLIFQSLIIGCAYLYTANSTIQLYVQIQDGDVLTW